MGAKLIYGDEARLLPWAAERIGIDRFRRDAYTIGVEKDGELAAVAVFDTFSDSECSVHLASNGSKRWMNKEFLVCCFAYPFIQLGFESITGVVPADNERALSFNEHIGWQRIGVRRRSLPGGRDTVIMEMLRADCRFIPEEHRK